MAIDWQQLAKDRLLSSYNVTEEYEFVPNRDFLPAVKSLSRALEMFDKGFVKHLVNFPLKLEALLH